MKFALDAREQFGNLNNLYKNVKNTSINNIAFCFLNVCGLKKRLLCPEFIDIIKAHDICIFVETKLNELDVLHLPESYVYVVRNRKSCKRASGGIAVIYKKELNSMLKFNIKKDSQFVLWFQLSKTVLKLDSDLVFGCVYIPP
jgi:hypothetical protein